MGHSLTLEVPDTVYEPLAKTAEQKGQTPEELAVEWLATAVQQCADDPLEKFIGAFDSGVTDLGTHHDDYLGQHLLEELRDQEDGDRQ